MRARSKCLFAVLLLCGLLRPLWRKPRMTQPANECRPRSCGFSRRGAIPLETRTSGVRLLPGPPTVEPVSTSEDRP